MGQGASKSHQCAGRMCSWDTNVDMELLGQDSQEDLLNEVFWLGLNLLHHDTIFPLDLGT